MPTAGKGIVLLSGKGAVLSSGKGALFNGDGECSACCGFPIGEGCDECDEGTTPATVYADFEDVIPCWGAGYTQEQQDGAAWVANKMNTTLHVLLQDAPACSWLVLYANIPIENWSHLSLRFNFGGGAAFLTAWVYCYEDDRSVFADSNVIDYPRGDCRLGWPESFTNENTCPGPPCAGGTGLVWP